MSCSKKKLTLNSVSINLGCGTCRRQKLGFIFNPKPKLKNPIYQKHKKIHHHNSSSTTLWKEREKDRYIEISTSTTTNTTPTTNTSFSPCYFDSEKSSFKGFGRVGNEGVAVEKDSDDPYLDFRHSMLQMILENEIYSKNDLRELLNCFLQLNSKENHGVIIRAFTEIWNGVFSVRSGLSPGFHINRKSRDF